MKIFFTAKNLFVILFLFLTGFSEAQVASLKATFSLINESGINIPYQNGMPVPTFSRQDRQIIDLDGTWKKLRFTADHNISLADRDSSGYANL